jgi:hypothetical protein
VLFVDIYRNVAAIRDLRTIKLHRGGAETQRTQILPLRLRASAVHWLLVAAEAGAVCVRVEKGNGKRCCSENLLLLAFAIT